MVYIIDLEAFPESHRDSGMQPQSELMFLKFKPLLCLVTPSLFLERARVGADRMMP